MSTEAPIDVPERLRALVSQVTVLRSGDRRPLVRVPDPDTSLLYRRTAAGHADLLVAGPRTRATYHVGKDIPLCIRIRLRPGAARPLFGVAVGELVDRVVLLEELWDDAPPAPTGGSARILRHLETALLRRLAARSSSEVARGELVRAAAEALEGHPGRRREPLPALARRLAVSERHLRDVFADGVGLPPKRFERIGRVRSVLAQGRRAPWGQLAAAAGYYDQSHMTAEFRDLMGVTPGAFFAGRLPTLEAC
ncbi:AraC family transcriptional regulator [Nonomuraea sp. FMUSA5-5]|uniref:AraC family transcriptional regulator n=1 Tax=Nonomuraea composti TaxID=2720023 RepID=A0ABX1AWJ8_9ACTN|nr:AraC family transcriptional regulator [Nonomuraea sp. FMUSA5-5]NJP89306.1 AraC family transcriptional regulator [Nonomuraea sp. FMUSA5-5]